VGTLNLPRQVGMVDNYVDMVVVVEEEEEEEEEERL
jgi:hypothetical protein